MGTPSELTESLSPTKRALLALKQLQSKLDALESAKYEPIAIIGIGCRFPGGADHPEAFWQLLRSGVDAITEVPQERWNIDSYYDPDPNTLGKMYTRYGGFVPHLQEFDAQFFRISPREALSLDPQQRLLLEVSWEALENAGLAPEKLTGSQTGVFIGICGNDYWHRLLMREPTEIDAYLTTGNTHSLASGRLSYSLGLTGPSLSVDTACSSSLVAVHLAVTSLRNQECGLALAGGVNRILAPQTSINFSKARMLSPEGRCKTFDAAANGFVRAEGCGVIVLKRLSDAVASGDHILAVICGSAVNQDGRTSGLTVPNGPSQEAVIRQALNNSRIEPTQVSYLETHGTGTFLGDPIEIQALGAIFAKERSHQPLIVSSVKTNIGHLEAAAGIASLIKVVLALQHQEIPPHLHFHTPNPHVNWEELPFKVPTERMPWFKDDKPRIAGVSSFGFSGTNAHVVLAEAPEEGRGQEAGGRSQESGVRSQELEVRRDGFPNPPVQTFNERPVHLLTLSAKSEKALRELAQRYEAFLASHPGLEVGNICFTANTGRSHFNDRLSILATSPSELQEKLAVFTNNQEAVGILQGRVKDTSKPKVAFLFTGQGSEYIGMGRQLYETQPTFRATLERCSEILRSFLEKPLLEVLYPPLGKGGQGSRGAEGQRGREGGEIRGTRETRENNSDSPLPITHYLDQTALFALEYSLAQLWMSWGIEPAAVIGHGVGEYVAATVAGVFSLEDGLKLMATLSRLLQGLPSDGEMVAVMAAETQVRDILQSCGQEVFIAAVNSPQNLVISGRQHAIAAICATLQAQGVKTQRLNVSPVPSLLLEPILGDFEAVTQTLSYSEPCIPLISGVTGEMAQADIATSNYWVRQLRQPVKFAEGMKTLGQAGYKIFVEMGPQPILLGMGRSILEGAEWRTEEEGREQGRTFDLQPSTFNLQPKLWLPSLRPGRDDWQQILRSLAQLYIQGVSIDWSGFERDYLRYKVVLPTYPFQRQRYWLAE